MKITNTKTNSNQNKKKMTTMSTIKISKNKTKSKNQKSLTNKIISWSKKKISKFKRLSLQRATLQPNQVLFNSNSKFNFYLFIYFIDSFIHLKQKIIIKIFKFFYFTPFLKLVITKFILF